MLVRSGKVLDYIGLHEVKQYARDSKSTEPRRPPAGSNLTLSPLPLEADGGFADMDFTFSMQTRSSH